MIVKVSVPVRHVRQGRLLSAAIKLFQKKLEVSLVGVLS